MRIPLESYFQSAPAKVFSLVASVPYTPVDLDLNLLARGQWDAVCDRFRVWYLSKEQAHADRPVCYVMMRKFDREQGVLTVAHVVMNLGDGIDGSAESNFTLGVLSNDDVRARSILGAMLGIPPIFHQRTEIQLVERRWRNEPETVAQFAANVYSAIGASSGSSGAVHQLKLELPADLMNKIGPGLDNWWDDRKKSSSN